MTTMDRRQTVTPYRAGDRADALTLLARLFPPESLVRAPLEQQIEAGFPGNAATLLVREGQQLQGAVLVSRRPLLRTTGRMMSTLAMPGCSVDPGAAFSAAARAAAGVGVSHLAVVLPETSVDAIASAEQHGFRFVYRQQQMAAAAPMAIAAVPPGVALDCSYDGRDRHRNAQVGDLLTRMFRGDPMVPPADAATVAAMIESPGARWIVARETATGEIAGAAEVYAHTGLFNIICVARRYWASGLAAALASRAIALLFDAGHRRIVSCVRPGNAASLALHRLCGAEPTGAYVRYYEHDVDTLAGGRQPGFPVRRAKPT